MPGSVFYVLSCQISQKTAGFPRPVQVYGKTIRKLMIGKEAMIERQ